MASIYTIGHSTRRFEEFTATLRAHSIQAVIDIRAFPGSRRFPHFSRQSLEGALAAEGFQYRWLEGLGGRRRKTLEVSPNSALRSASFRNYADHMLTPEFNQAAGHLIEIAAEWRAAMMCAERLYFRCHRMLVSDWLVAHGHEVLHIDDARPPVAHKLLPEAQIVNGQLLYRGSLLI
ncbi:MAG: DUF488 domain-containing protein [Acidobacteria bacterium]|nr:DUF488 domain-containing protein [Acidobacteriota bacterium]MBV9625736.1 DUF488 domain-containing protein [Acidobacteriota bacterium]